jgi:hypothetical protein
MKICPFMSHMLGSEANVLEVGTPGDGAYDDRGGNVSVKTKSKTDAAQKPMASNLY